jgi:hypothetical protein
VLIWIFWGYFLYEYLTSFILGFTSDFYVGNAIALGLEALDGKMEG